MPSADIISLRGNCIDTITSAQLSSGAEIWRVRTSAGDQALGQRAIPDGGLDVNMPTLPGEYVYYVSAVEQGYGGPIDVGGEGGYPGVTITVAGGSPAQASAPTQLSTPLTTLQTRRMRNNLDQAQARLRTLRNSRSTALLDVQGVPLPEKKNEPGEDKDKQAGKQRFGVYVMGLGDYLRHNGSSSDAEFNLRTTSLSVGADYRLGDAWVFGGNVGVSDSKVGFAGSDSKQTSRGDQVTAYASWNLSPSTYASATLSYEANRFNLTRDDGAGQLSLSSPRGHGVGVSLSAGRDFAIGAWSFGPYVRWDNVSSSVGAFEESGGTSPLSVGAQEVRSNTLNGGAQVQLSVPLSSGIVLPYVRLELTRRSDKTSEAPTATLLNGNTTLLLPTAADTSSTYGNLALGVSYLNQHGVSWFADYESGIAQKGYRSRRFGLGLRVEL